MSQIIKSAAVHDVVVIGSGAGGGTVTKVLADLGVSVLLMEAGPMVSPADFKEHMAPYDVRHRGAGERAEAYFGERVALGFSATYGGAQLEGEPYTVAEGSEFRWFRSRCIGGRTNHYGRITLRFADYDFTPRSRDGLGWDWPISYEDLAPYYDKTEKFIGVTGSVEGIRSAPDGIFQPPAARRVHDVLVQRACAKLGIRAIPGRRAVITRPTNDRPACHYCGQCGRGCKTASNYASSYVQIFPAMKTGRVQVITGAMARELVTDRDGRVTAVSYIDKTSGRERQVQCRTVVLAASACESARLLLNSKSARHPTGVANSSGHVGRYLMDTVGFTMSASVPALAGMPRYNSDGYGGHLYVPWWLWDEHKKLDFPRGYHIEVSGGYGMPGIGSFDSTLEQHEGYGLSLKEAIRDGYGVTVSLSGRGEMIPNEHCYCEIDPDVKDRWGIPVLRFHWAWSDHELAQVRHMQTTFRAILETMGGLIDPRRRRRASDDAPISTGGAIIHEVGTVRMGDDRRSSVLNKYCQAHEVKNLFVADGGPFVGNPDKNPTHTIIALAWRTAEYLAEEMRKGNV
ncbi:MAG: GMC family oxidoreductase [Vicinamibacteraceae bacterium]